MSGLNHIQMQFKCNQQWEHMKDSANGRFCDQCKHEVFDFSNMNIEQIRAKAKKGVLCGNFRVEQTEDLTPVEFKSIKKTKYWLATIATFSGLELNKANAQHYRPEVRCEITGQCKDSTNTITVKKESPAPETPVSKEESEPRVVNKKITTIGKYGIYTSRKFPFIRIRKRHVLGRYARFL